MARPRTGKHIKLQVCIAGRSSTCARHRAHHKRTAMRQKAAGGGSRDESSSSAPWPA